MPASAAADLFVRLDFDLSRLGQKQCYRIYYEIKVTTAEVRRYVLHEGAAMKLFAPDELFDLRLTPYEFLCALAAFCPRPLWQRVARRSERSRSMRVLVVGGDSLIGEAFAQATTQRGDTVFATTRRKELADRISLFLDLARDDIDQIALPPVDSAFFCAAVSGFAVCRTDPALARRVNVEGTAKLVRRLTDRGIYCVLLSSTAVFNFQKPHVAPDTPTCPLTMHGQIKAEAEDIFRAQGALGAILRLTKVITPNAALFAKWVARSPPADQSPLIRTFILRR